MWAIILDQFSDDRLSSFWNWWLLVGEGFAGAAVAWGIVCESNPSKVVQKYAHRHVILGVTFEVALSLLLFMSEEHISKDQRTQIIALEKAANSRRLVGSVEASQWSAAAHLKFSGIFRTPMRPMDAYIQAVPDFDAEVLAIELARA